MEWLKNLFKKKSEEDSSNFNDLNNNFVDCDSNCSCDCNDETCSGSSSDSCSCDCDCGNS